MVNHPRFIYFCSSPSIGDWDVLSGKMVSRLTSFCDVANHARTNPMQHQTGPFIAISKILTTKRECHARREAKPKKTKAPTQPPQTAETFPLTFAAMIEPFKPEPAQNDKKALAIIAKPK